VIAENLKTWEIVGELAEETLRKNYLSTSPAKK
jgi:hypothetical protein